MPQTFSKAFLSQEGAGQGWLVGTSKTAIHRSGTNPNKIGEIWLYAANSSTATRTLNVHWADTSAGGTGGSTIKATIPVSSGPVLVIPGLILGPANGGASELWINVSADVGSAVVVYGYVNEINSTNGFIY